MKQWLIRKGREARGGEIDWDAILTDYVIAKKPRTDTFHLYAVHQPCGLPLPPIHQPAV